MKKVRGRMMKNYGNWGGKKNLLYTGDRQRPL